MSGDSLGEGFEMIPALENRDNASSAEFFGGVDQPLAGGDEVGGFEFESGDTVESVSVESRRDDE